ncbi:MAG: DUF3102 domain-containing protein [Ruminococcus sp.]|nr:DUF3102 domain-containing protein [Ruminococcus sp.]
MEEIMLQPQQEAVIVTERIRANGKIAVNAVCNIGKDLRYMKIEELYRHIGYESFEEYAEKEFSLKRRQAYQYISVYENLGEEFVQSNAQLGITKLALLTQVNIEDRNELMSENDLEGMTVNEIKELIEKFKIQGEQLSFLENENEELKKQTPKDLEERIADLEKANKRLMGKIDLAEREAALSRKNEEAACGKLSVLKTDFDMQKEKIAQQEAQIKELESRPVDVAVKEVIKEVPDTKAIEKKDKEIEKLQKQYSKLESEQEQAIEAVKKEYENKLAEMRRSSAEALDNVDKSSFKNIYTSAYKEMNGLLEFVRESEGTDKTAYIEAVEKLIYAISDSIDKLKQE